MFRAVCQARHNRPSEIVRIKPMQAIKIDRVVVARRMQHHTVRRRPRLFVADIGVAHETSMMIDGSPPVDAVPDQLATGFAAPLDFLENAVVSWPVRMIAPPSVVTVSGPPARLRSVFIGRVFLSSPPPTPKATHRAIQSFTR